MTAPYHGHFCWYELLTDDVAAAERFYGDVLGWTARRAETPGVDYHLFARDGQDAAGFMAMPERMREGGGRPVSVGLPTWPSRTLTLGCAPPRPRVRRSTSRR